MSLCLVSCCQSRDGQNKVSKLTAVVMIVEIMFVPRLTERAGVIAEPASGMGKYADNKNSMWFIEGNR